MNRIEKEWLTLENAADAIASAVWAMEAVRDAKTIGDFAEAIRQINDSCSDLASWHPNYNHETGEIDA